MKDVANCVKHCDLRNSVNQWRVESMRYPHIHVEVSLDRCIDSAQLLRWDNTTSTMQPMLTANESGMEDQKSDVNDRSDGHGGHQNSDPQCEDHCQIPDLRDSYLQNLSI